MTPVNEFLLNPSSCSQDILVAGLTPLIDAKVLGVDHSQNVQDSIYVMGYLQIKLNSTDLLYSI